MSENEYIAPNGPLNMDQVNDKMNHKNMMIGIAYDLTDVEFDYAKNYTNVKKMWNKLNLICGGYYNVRRGKDESLRDMHDDMRMKYCENATHYVN